MFSASYASDAHSKASDLASEILSASSSLQISSCCSSLVSFLLKHTPDQTRFFFSVTFPTLICKLFGFDHSSSPLHRLPRSPNGWIDIVTSSNDSDLLGRVYSLLSPNGVLMSSVAAADRLSLVKFIFPVERLPGWVRYMLQNQRDCRVLADLCPLFKGRLKEDLVKGSSFQIQLNLFEYYMFWFAYFPVCRGNSEDCDALTAQRSKKSRLENWANSIPVLAGSWRCRERKQEFNLYMRLLYAYLRAFVPPRDLNALQPYRSSLLHYSSGYDSSVMDQAEFLVNTLVHFWLVDNDFSPVSLNLCKSLGFSIPFRSVLGVSPPTPDLGEFVNLFVKYLNSLVIHPDGCKQLESPGTPTWRVATNRDGKLRDGTMGFVHIGYSSSWNSCIQRQLYRYILRTFLYCPVETSVKNLSQVFSVWTNYMEPWMINIKDFAALASDANKSSGSNANGGSQASFTGYSSDWQCFVLNNYLFYSSLVMHFIGFAHKFLHTDAEVAVRMVTKVISILTSSSELLDLLKNVDVVFHSKPAGSSKSSFNHLYRLVPTIREQLQDWEDGLCEKDADGSFLHENWNKDLRLFSDGEDGGRQLLQLFVLRGESELQALSGDNLQRVADSLKCQLRCLFGGSIVEAMPSAPQERHWFESRDELFKPTKIGNYAVADAEYRGDWMKRPISNDEVAWLAKLLVGISCWLNKTIGLNEGDSSQVGPASTFVDLSSDVQNVCGPSETLKVLLSSVSGWMMVLVGAALQFMKRFGIRVNLRIFASKKAVTVLLIVVAFCLLKKSICGF